MIREATYWLNTIPQWINVLKGYAPLNSKFLNSQFSHICYLSTHMDGKKQNLKLGSGSCF